jgi:transposase-like protein
LAITSIKLRKVGAYLTASADRDIGHEKKMMNYEEDILSCSSEEKNEKISPFVKTASYKIALFQRTLLP